MVICLFFLRGTFEQWVDYSFLQRVGNLIFIILISGNLFMFTSLRLLGFDFNGFFKKTLHSL